jgi:hypothetical protein
MAGPRPPKNQIYQYRDNDSPVTVASQFGITPQALISANPGGTPFSTGQSINVPLQYGAPIGPQPFIGPQPAPFNQRPPSGYGPGAVPGSAPTVGFTPTGYNTDDSWFRTTQQAAQANAAQIRLNQGVQAPTTQQQLQGATPGTLGQGDFYGYERDPETGRSVRVVKNSSNANFLSELRWDPQARRYVSIGRLLKQGKLDLKGNWRRQSRRQRQTAKPKQQQEQRQQDFTLANSMISFGGSSG